MDSINSCGCDDRRAFSGLLSRNEIIAFAGGRQRLMREEPNVFDFGVRSIVHRKGVGSLWKCMIAIASYADGELWRDIRVYVTLQGPDFVRSGLVPRFSLELPQNAMTAPFKQIDSINVEVVENPFGDDFPYSARLNGAFAAADLDDKFLFSIGPYALPNLEKLFKYSEDTGDLTAASWIETKCEPWREGDGSLICYERTCYRNFDGTKRCTEFKPKPGTIGCATCR
jgi:hypothetical protein